MKSTLKKDIIYNLALSTELEELKEKNIILLTGLGIIEGRLITEEDTADKDSQDMLMDTLVENISKKYRELHEIPGDVLIPGNDGCITLKEVSITSNGFHTELPYLVVFFDQIIGISVGNINKEV